MFISKESSLIDLSKQGVDVNRLENWVNPQSMAFMVDLMPTIRELFTNNRVLRVLDVGSRSGAGVALLDKMYGLKSMSKIKLDFTCLDIDDLFTDYFKANCPNIRYEVGDIFSLNEKFDLVICSHVIEHVPEPDKFLACLKGLAYEFVILNCPYMENTDNLSPGHVNSIGMDFLEMNGCIKMHIYEGMYWRQGAMVISVFKGDCA